MERVIIGCGPGRSGTTSLSVLLNSQKDWRCDHESIRMPWEFEIEYAIEAANFFNYARKEYGLVGDVASWYLHYIPYFLEEVECCRAVIMTRTPGEVARSFIEKAGGKHKRANHWTAYDSKFREDVKPHAFDMHFPKFNLPMKEAIERYASGYMHRANELCAQYPNHVRVYDFADLLNISRIQKDFLKWAGVDRPKILLGIQANKRNSLKILYKIWQKEREENDKDSVDVLE